MKKETILLHEGFNREQHIKPAAVPIYQTTSYLFDSDSHAAKLFNLEDEGFIYTRIGNPTQDVLEKRLAALHNANACVALSSGQSANTFAILNIAKPGDNIVSSKFIYGGTYNAFHHTLRKFGIEFRFVDSRLPENFQNSIDENTKAFFMETIGNPVNNVDDFEKISEIAHKNNVPLIVDNTVAPYIFNPFEFGADIVTYSLTKFITGNGTSIGGAIIEKGGFNWGNGKFPDFTEKDESYHGLNYFETFGEDGTAFIYKIRLQLLRDIGACISPFNAFLSLTGLETLRLRITKQCENALQVAKFLDSHPEVEYVNYPGLRNNGFHRNAEKYLKPHYGAIIGFGVKGGYEKAKKIINSVKLILHLANIGDSRTLIIHPASTTHMQLSKKEREEALIYDNFIRLSVGLENIEDILEDLDNALRG